MKKGLLFGIFMFCATFMLGQSPIGIWKTIDDETGKAKSYVEIYEKNGKLHGKVIKILTEGKQNAKCTKCSGDKKNKPISGLEILWDLEKDGDEWSGGKILDPNNGKKYKCYIKLENKNKLKVRGYLGFSLIGRSQYWERVK